MFRVFIHFACLYILYKNFKLKKFYFPCLYIKDKNNYNKNF